MNLPIRSEIFVLGNGIEVIVTGRFIDVDVEMHSSDDDEALGGEEGDE